MRSKINLPMDEIIKDYQSGMSLRELGGWYGCGTSTIVRQLRKAGVQIRKGNTKKKGF
jgi:acyl CoA:acetate/3-ketoacid CoA transferase alpha subunit